MTTVALHNSFRTVFAINFGELQIGDVPADAAAWEGAEGTDVFLLKPLEADPSYILGDSAVPNVDMQPAVFEKDRPHKGLPTADGGALLTRLWSTGEVWTDDTQVLGGTPSVLGALLAHALGASELGHHTTIAVVTSQTSLEVASASNLAPGYIIAIEDGDDPGRYFPVQVLTVVGAAITVDRELPFTIVVGDKVAGAEQAWPKAEALTNPLDPGYSTLSLLYVKGAAHVWMAGGVHLGWTELQLPRGEQPKVNFEILAARGYPQGAGAPTVPTFTGAIEGTDRDVAAVGHDTQIYLNDFGVTAANCTSVFESSFTPGVPIVAEDGVTECDEGSPGRVSYRTEPADTTLEIVVALTDDQQARWVDGTFVAASMFQVAPVGRGWAVHIRKGFLIGPPVPVLEGVNKYRITIQASADASVAATGEALAAKFVVARF